MFRGNPLTESRNRGEVVDDFDSDNGDLGLGSGLKPGGICSPHSLPLYNLSPTRCGPGKEDNPLDVQSHSEQSDKHKKGKVTRLFSRSSSRTSRKSSEGQYSPEGDVPSKEIEFPSYADIPYGTSIRQQKLLFEKDLGHIYLKKSPSDLTDSDILAGNEKTNITPLKSDEIERKLQQAKQEVEELQLELENCQRRLDAKYRAIDILKQQAKDACNETEQRDKKSSDYNHRLEQEINHLNFVLHYHESSTLNSQRMWASRFDRVCQENSSLMVTLKTRSEELRKVTAKNMALLRERDELLALLDVQERLQYEKSRTSVSEDDLYNDFSSAELAVLGACTCRGRRPEPCGCAVAAANMRKEIVKLREEMEMYEERTLEAYTTVEAYRIAFDEQILRNKDLGVKLAEISTQSPSKGSKAKNIIKWIISNLNEEEKLQVERSHNCSTNHKSQPEIDGIEVNQFSDRELLIIILDMMNEKSELRAHQKIAAQILAKKNQELESKLVIANGETPYN